MTDAAIERLCERLDSLSALEPGWYANVGKRTGEQCCAAMRDAAALIRSQAERVKALEGALTDVVTAWERLSGDQPSWRVEEWLADDMKPAIDAIRRVLNPTGEPT